jgi:glucose/arabinose dehydrogenase
MKNTTSALLLGASLVSASALSQVAADTTSRPAARIAQDLCAGCHGPNLVGGSAPNLIDSIWVHGSSDEDIRKSIRDGFPQKGMVGYGSQLSEAEQTSMISYIRSQSRRFAFGQIPAPSPPDSVVLKSEKQEFRLETVAASLDTPWGLAFLPNGDMLVTERPGALRLIRKGKLVAEPIRDTPKPYVRQDAGYFDVSVHPDHAKNGWIYLAYSDSIGEAAAGTRPQSMTVIVRGRIRDGAWVDEQTIFRASPEFYYRDDTHYGCRFYWDKQGHLFFTLGERGKSLDAQDLKSPLGKIHRVMDDGSIPPDNPFVNQAGAVASIWSYGNRNPQGLQYHPVTGKMWATEHGPAAGDELNRIDPGRNYGWPTISRGTSFAGETIEGTERAGMEQPVIWWTPTVAPSGITFYTGNRFRAWKNDLFIATLFGRSLRRVTTDGDKVTHQEVVFAEMGRVRTVVQGPDGYLYVLLASPGRVARMTPVAKGTYDREQARLQRVKDAATPR